MPIRIRRHRVVYAWDIARQVQGLQAAIVEVFLQNSGVCQRKIPGRGLKICEFKSRLRDQVVLPEYEVLFLS
jgi:hypothetical protein